MAHANHIDAWISWKDEGIGTIRWSDNYRIIQTSYLHKYVETYEEVSARNLEACLRAIPVTSHSKRKHIHSAVSSFAEFLVNIRILSIEEREKIRKLYPKRNRYNPPTKKTITSSELNTIVEAASKSHHRYQSHLNVTLIRILGLTGLRVSEACNLKLSDITLLPLERAHLKVVCGKGGKDRIVPLTPEAVSVIESYLKIRPNIEFKEIFIGFNPVNGYQILDRHCVARRLRRISSATGIPFTSHSLRHYCITAWAKDPRLTLPIVQKLAGHSSVTITEGYINIATDDLFKALNQTA